MDNLARCAMLAKRDGMSYGQWMAIYGEKINLKRGTKIPEGWKFCEGCRKPFKGKANQRYCDIHCRKIVYGKKYRETRGCEIKEYHQKWYQERKKKNEGSC